MSLADQLEIKRTDKRRDRLRPIKYVDVNIDYRDISCHIDSQYLLTAKFCYPFWTTKNGLDYDINKAKQQLLYNVFQPLINNAHLLEYTISQGDPDRAIDLLHNIMEDLGLQEFI